MTPSLPDLTVFQAYRVKTTASRTLEVLFRGTVPNSRRLWFTELDPPYSDVLLRKQHIVSIRKLTAQERSPS